MIIGEQLNHHQQQQQQQAQQEIATTNRSTVTQQQNHRRHSTNTLPGQSNSNNGGSNNNNTKSTNNGNSNSSSGSSNSNNNNGGNGTGSVGLVGGGTSAAAAKNQLEQLNTMREALFSQDGWGCQHVNQDTSWEVPGSPEPTNKDPTGGPTIWKPTINNGTDLWESNLRNGGQPPTQPVQKTPWGHTPSSNLGGTWGEDDDGADSSSVWTGSSNNPTAAGGVGVAGVGAGGVVAGGPNNGPQWGQGSVGVGGASNAAVAATGNIAGVTAAGATGVNVPGGVAAVTTGGAAGNGWGDSRELRSGAMGGPMDMRNVDPRDPMRAASSGEPRDLRMLDPRDPIRGDPRGISGRLNGTSEMWGQHHSIAHSQMPAMNKMVGPGVGVGAAVTSGAVVAAGGVSGIGPSVNAINTGGVGGNVGAHWGAGQTGVGPKDIASMSNKPVTGWEEPSPPPQRRNIQNYDDGTSLWGQQSRVPGGGSHWKDMSDPMNRHLIRNTIGNQNPPNTVANLGGGTASGQAGGIGAPGGVGVGGNPNNPMAGVGPQGRLSSTVGPGVGVGQHKPDNAMWVHPSNAGVSGRNASWGDDGNHNVGAAPGANWVDDKSNASIGQLGANIGGANSWNDSPASWNKNQNKMSSGAAGWGAAGGNDGNDLTSDWSTHGGIVGKPQQKLGNVNVAVGGLNTDMIKQSKQYRMLVENGFKKEDVERALISANMNIEEAAEMLRANATIAMDTWRRHDETLSSYADHTNSGGGGGFPGRYPAAGTQPTLPFPPNNLLNNMSSSAVGAGGNNPNLAALNSMQPLQVQKYLNQGPHNVTGGPQSVNPAAVAFGQNPANVTAAAVNAVSNSNNQPSTQQLRMLVQQIQLAVHSGYLSSQILTEPLPSSVLVLLYQLLTNIKHLQGAQQSLARGGNNANIMQINLAIAKYKQQIQNLQNQINAQQAYILKTKPPMPQNPQHPAAHVNNSNTEYLRGQHDAISALQSNFSEMNLNKSSAYPGAPNQQSRLTQWKLPLDKDMTSDNTDFSRAPGATKQGLSGTNTNTMGPLGLQNDGTWSTGRNIGDGWPDAPTDNENKDWSVAQPTSATTYTDLVQEFEPGKPWKGSQIKSIEDDPSITPGSVARSPLSINPTPKDADIFANPSKNSPTDLTPLSLSSSTWSFNPSSSNQNFPSWSDNPQQCATSELWAMNKTSRGPPPGLGSNKGSVVSVAGVSSVTNPSPVVAGGSNGWIVGGRGVPNTNSSWTGTNSNWNSTWLLLKNLTTQIDGSTLRTLCMQHGPLLNFHLYLNQGIALCKYATREEANKAQMTLNNCVLGNTTICAESPSESEVQSILQHLPQTSNPTGTPGSNSNSCNGGGGNGGGGTGGLTSNGGGAGGNGSGGNNGGGNGNIAGNSVVNGAGGNSGNNASNSSNAGGNISTGNSQGQPGACSSNGGNNGNGSNNTAAGNTNNVVAGGNNSAAAAAWRQTQNQQNQQRPSGREADFDYISKYVCSIVDD